MTIKQMKGTLFIVIVGLFTITGVVTILGITDLLKVREEYLGKLFVSLLLELIGAVLFLFKNADFFGQNVVEAVQMPDPTTKPQSAGLDIRLEAADAVRHGSTIQYEDNEQQENIGYWNSLNDFVSWDFTVTHPTSFYIIVEQACDPKVGGGEYIVQCGSQKLSVKVVNTGSWLNFVRIRIGRITIASPGKHTIMVQPTKITNAALMNLRRLILH